MTIPRICPHCASPYVGAHTCPKPRGLGLACVHGQLARVCLTCEHERTIAELKAYLRKAVGRLRDVDRACGGQTKLLEGLEHD